MAEAKVDRRRPWRAYQPSMSERAVSRFALRKDLSSALAANALNLHYQPVVDLRTGIVVAFEALSRWQHPWQGAIPPDSFVPLAEETGLIVPLGRWALRQAVADLAQLRQLVSRKCPLRVAVNVSALQLAEPDFTADVAAALEANDVPADALCLEITESSVIDGAGRTLDALRDLKSMGVTLAIDDFGTGHSALSYLPDMPFDILKVDKSFIDTIETSTARAEVVRGIVGIAAAVGMRVVAEGIETSGQERMLMDTSCHYGQGFLYSRPVPLAKAMQLLGPGATPPHARVNGNHYSPSTIGFA
jgi:EAL domain-containing protein (putative c-di-GMP-specific phosphodiesterase class I)